MGGSSLAPEVLRRSFGARQHGRLRLHVLDSTDAGAVRAVERAVDLDHTLFLVSTKSGGTIETLLAVRALLGAAARRRAVRRDHRPGLVAARSWPRERGFRRTFLNDPDIGGRYSALSYFGLVPAALIGVDLERAARGRGRGRRGVLGRLDREGNSGLWLGAALGALAQCRAATS